MIKFVILLAVVAVARADDLDDVVGEAVAVAVTPPPGKATPECTSYQLKKTDVQCTCKGNTVTVAELTRGAPDNIHVLPIVVRSAEAAAAAMSIKFADCSCPGDINPEVGVLRIVNDNYFITYVPIYDKGDQKMALLNRRRPASRDDLDAVIKSIGFDQNDYALLCHNFA